MRTVGAISVSNQDTCIYFCDASVSELDQIPLPGATKHLAKVSAKGHVMLALESRDEMQNDIRCIGIMFIDTEGCCFSSIHQSLQPFEADMRQIFEWEYCPKQVIAWS